MDRRMSFHIGEFARITGVNKRTLHYYDNEGIFCPDQLEENGYRSYSSRQIYPFFLLRMFRDMGLDLSEIKEYRRQKSPRVFQAVLEGQDEWLSQEIAKLKKMQFIVREQEKLLEMADRVVCGQVELVELPAATYLLSRPLRQLSLKGQKATIDKLTTEHLHYVLVNELNYGYGLSMMVSPEDFLVPGQESRPSFFCTRTEAPLRQLPAELRHRRPAGIYAVTYFRGDYDETAPAYSLLRSFFKENGLQPSGCSYEEGILDERSSASIDNFLTSITVPVEKI